jgi:hypothetical protein
MEDPMSRLSANGSLVDRPATSYRVGQRVFGRHGATLEYFDGHVVATDKDCLFPYTVEVGLDEPIRVLETEIESDLPAPGLTWDELVDWLV